MNKYKKFTSWENQEKKWMQNPEFVKVAAKHEAEYQLARAIIAKRIEQGLSQAQLAEKMKTSQSAIARVESGSHTASIAFIKRLAVAFNSTLKISFS